MNKEIATEIIEDLKGTCKSLEEVCEYYEVDPNEFLKHHCYDLDDQIFNCGVCGWWYEIGEAADDEHRLICINCNEDE